MADKFCVHECNNNCLIYGERERALIPRQVAPVATCDGAVFNHSSGGTSTLRQRKGRAHPPHNVIM